MAGYGDENESDCDGDDPSWALVDHLHCSSSSSSCSLTMDSVTEPMRMVVQPTVVSIWVVEVAVVAEMMLKTPYRYCYYY